MNIDLGTLSVTKYHKFWGFDLTIGLETIFDQDAIIHEIEPALKPQNCLRTSRDFRTGRTKKMISHSAVVGADMSVVRSGETSFVCWADESNSEGEVLCFRAKHLKAGRDKEGKDIFHLLFSQVLFARFGEEKAWGFERGPFMKLEAFTYSDPFRTLYVKLRDDSIHYLKVDLERNECATVLRAERISKDSAPAHLVSAAFL